MPGAQAEGPPVSCSWPHRTTAAATRFRRRQRIPFRWRAVACRGVAVQSLHLPPSEPEGWLFRAGRGSTYVARAAELAPNSWLATCLQIVGAGGGVGSKELAAQGNIHKYGARRPANMNNRPAGSGKTGKWEQAARHITAITRNGHHQFPGP